MSHCNLDMDHPCDANDGEPCERCAANLAEDERYWGAQWAAASPAERNLARYEQDMRDAGRGHLLASWWTQ